MKIKIKSIWQGKIAFRDKYLKEGLEKGLIIEYQNKIMTLSKDEVKTKMVGKSDKPFFDRYSNELHYLVYYYWKPDDANQQKLI